MLLLAQDWLVPFTASPVPFSYILTPQEWGTEQRNEGWEQISLTLLGIILILFHWCLLLFCLPWPVTDDGLCVATVHKLLTLCAMAEPSAASRHSGPCPAWMLHLPSVPTCFLQLGSIHSEGSSVEQVSGKMPLPSTLFYKCPLDLELTCLFQA